MRTKSLWIIAVCIAAAGCGAPFTAIEERVILILEYGVWEAPPPDDVCVDLPRPMRHEPDAGRSR